MLGKTIQSVANMAALKEGYDIFKKFAGTDSVQKNIGDQIKSQLSSKGLTDEGAFERVLVGVTEKWPDNSTLEKLILLRKSMSFLEDHDLLEGTKIAQYARIIFLAADLKSDGQLTIVTQDGKGRTNGNTTVSISDFTPCSVRSIKNMLDACATEDDFFDYLSSMGAFQKAPNGTLEELAVWFKGELLPLAKKVGVSSQKELANTILVVAELIEDSVVKKRTRRELAHSMPFLGKENDGWHRLYAPFRKIIYIAFYG